MSQNYITLFPEYQEQHTKSVTSERASVFQMAERTITATWMCSE
jgi:hypothetical protein